MNFLHARRNKLRSRLFLKLSLIILFILLGLTSYHYIAQDILGIEPKVGKILGTPSMYPTFPMTDENKDTQLPRDISMKVSIFKYDTVMSKYFSNWKYKFQRSDLVAFTNKEIKKMQELRHYRPYLFIKRVIAVPGDIVEIKNGLVFINDAPLFESYTANQLSTKPGNFLRDCSKITIPENKLFVMGDNRESSNDSRNFGPINFSDVQYYMPWESNKKYFISKYRDTVTEVKKYYDENLDICH